MKKNSLFNGFRIIFLLFLLTDLSAQNCALPTAEIDLEANNVRARLRVGGDLWRNGSDGAYIVPNETTTGDPKAAAIFSGGLWMGGFDPSGNLKLSAQTYGAINGRTAYWPGPLDENGNTDTDNCSNFDRFWSVREFAILDHIIDWEADGSIDNIIPASIAGWPGSGNPNFFEVNGFDLPNPTGSYAPFIDRNGNGLYEPLNGDYPDIKDASQGVWWVFNDAGNTDTQSGGEALQMEIQVLAYAYSSNNENINNATFYDYKFINRGVEPLDSTFIGLWVDFDLGCFTDDYIGCDKDQGLAYVYNRDDVDGELNCNDCQNVVTYCQEIPMVGVKMLEGVKAFQNNDLVDLGMSSFMYYNNPSSIPSPAPGTGDPDNPNQYYNYLTASWADGTRLTSGGTGYNLAGSFTNFAFPDAPSKQNAWSMCQENLPSQDPRVVIGSGPFTLQPGSVNTMSFAVIYAENVAHPCPNLDKLSLACEDVQDLYDGFATSTETLAEVSTTIELHPNPMLDQSTLTFNDLENKVDQISIFSIDGKEVQSHTNINGTSLEIQRGNLSPGIYFYKLRTDAFKIHSGKFIVQ